MFQRSARGSENHQEMPRDNIPWSRRRPRAQRPRRKVMARHVQTARIRKVDCELSRNALQCRGIFLRAALARIESIGFASSSSWFVACLVSVAKEVETWRRLKRNLVAFSCGDCTGSSRASPGNRNQRVGSGRGIGSTHLGYLHYAVVESHGSLSEWSAEGIVWLIGAGNRSANGKLNDQSFLGR